MTSKIRIWLPNIEVEYEGEQAFIASELLPMIEQLLTLAPHLGDRPAGKGQPNNGAGSAHQLGGTFNALAARLKPSSGPELILASLYHLAQADDQHTATRQEIHVRMKTAPGYYKGSYANNMSSYLDNLVKADKIRQPATKTYSLASNTNEELEAKLAQT